jgi:hypothetical protein
MNHLTQPEQLQHRRRLEKQGENKLAFQVSHIIFFRLLFSQFSLLGVSLYQSLSVDGYSEHYTTLDPD